MFHSLCKNMVINLIIIIGSKKGVFCYWDKGVNIAVMN
jgi:hypothetical protein